MSRYVTLRYVTSDIPFPLSMSLQQNPHRLTKSNRYTFSLSLSLSLSGCELPLGTAAQGLMYVNAEGTPVGEFEGTADNIREVFARMGFNDRMTVAAIGGGHAFGKKKIQLQQC